MYTNHTEIRNKITTTLTDAQLDAFAQSVSDYINSYIGYTLASDKTVASYYFDGSGTEYAFLNDVIHDYTKLDEISGLTASQVSVATLVNYPLNAPHIAYFGLRMGVFKGGMSNYCLKDAKLGRYSLATLPQEIKDLATSLAVKMTEAGGISTTSSGVSGLKTSETIGSYSVSYANNAGNSSVEQVFSTAIGAKEVLNQYKTISIV